VVPPADVAFSGLSRVASVLPGPVLCHRRDDGAGTEARDDDSQQTGTEAAPRFQRLGRIETDARREILDRETWLIQISVQISLKADRQ
jgi:hypothetical protein